VTSQRQDAASRTSALGRARHFHGALRPWITQCVRAEGRSHFLSLGVSQRGVVFVLPVRDRGPYNALQNTQPYVGAARYPGIAR